MNRPVCSQYKVGVVLKVGAGRTGNSNPITVGGKRFFLPGRKLADGHWEQSLLFDWKGRLITWDYSGRSVNLITHFHLVPRVTTNVATSALPRIPSRPARGSVTPSSRGLVFKTPVKSTNP